MAPLQIVIHTPDQRTFYDMPALSACNDCGACCRHFRVSFYQGELDSFPGGTVPLAMTSTLNPTMVCMQGTEHGGKRCIALQPDKRCAIYANRPTPCREFPVYMEDGTLNPRCIQLRMAQGIGMPAPPLQAA